VGPDGRGAGLLVLGVVGAERGEGAQRLLPVVAGLVGLVLGAVGVAQPVVGAGLVGGLPEPGRQLARWWRWRGRSATSP